MTSTWLPTIRPSLAASTLIRWRANRGQSQTVPTTEPVAATIMSAMNGALAGPMASAPRRRLRFHRTADPVEDAG